jgi:hypothetical protein
MGIGVWNFDFWDWEIISMHIEGLKSVILKWIARARRGWN